MTERKLIDCCPAALDELKAVKGWINATADHYFFCIAAARKDNPDQFGLFSFGDFIEIKDGRAYGVVGAKTVVNGQDKAAGTIKAKLRTLALKIAEWHENTFDQTVEGQRAKFEEEKKELAEAQALLSRAASIIKKRQKGKELSDAEKADPFSGLTGTSAKDAFNERSAKAWEEKADCFIVAAALAYRWQDKAGQEYLAAAERAAYPGRLLDAVIEKMGVNIARTKAGLWKKQPDGSFHH